MRDVFWSNSVSLDSLSKTWADLRDCPEVLAIRPLIQAAQPVAFLVTCSLDAIFVLLAAIGCSKADILVVSSNKVTDSVEDRILEAGFAIATIDGKIQKDARLACDPVPGRITLLTSGSTGTPKLVGHSFDSLFTAGRVRRNMPRTWLVPYQTASYAWFQLITLGLFCNQQNLVISESNDLSELFSTALQNRVDSISSTPTFWRLALLTLPENTLRGLGLKTITLGGELVDQGILNDLVALFPHADMTHIYASTEAGVGVVVGDKQAGFPESFLSREKSDVPLLRIVDGILQIKSPHAASQPSDSSDNGWINTGDRVEVRESRVYFCGRSDVALINVGGNKAFPADIEHAILGHPAIQWCRVKATRAPLVGFLPEADIVIKNHVAAPDEATLTEYCSAKLPDYAIPRFWNFLDSIPIQPSLKSPL